MALPWYPKDTGKYARDTKHLTMLEHGAYNLLLDHYYSNSGFDFSKGSSSAKASPQQSKKNAELMPDHSRLYRICGAISKQEQDAVDYVLECFFYLDKDGKYRHEKADKTIIEQEDKHQKKVEAGRKGGLSKAKAQPKHSSTNKNQNQTKKKKDSDPLNDFGDKKGDNFERAFCTERLINDKAMQRAKENAPGWDIYHLMRTFDEMVNSGNFERPKSVNGAFPAWCKSFTKGKRPD